MSFILLLKTPSFIFYCCLKYHFYLFKLKLKQTFKHRQSDKTERDLKYYLNKKSNKSLKSFEIQFLFQILITKRRRMHDDQSTGGEEDNQNGETGALSSSFSGPRSPHRHPWIPGQSHCQKYDINCVEYILSRQDFISGSNFFAYIYVFCLIDIKRSFFILTLFKH